MKTYLLNLWDATRSSYWFVPSLIALTGITLAVLLPWLDASLVAAERPLPDWIRTTTEAARSTLAAMAGAMVAVTGTVFSITIVTLSLASQQFGPRLLRRFMYDLPTQVTLGVFLSTGVYCLLVLRAVEHHESAVAPHLSVLTAVALTLLSMAMLIMFIHHIAMLIQAPHVVAGVAKDLNDAIVRLFPDRIGEATEEYQAEAVPEEQAEAVNEQAEQLGDDFLVIRSTQAGYIQAIDPNGLLQLACEHQLVLRLRSRPGNFIAHGTLLADFWPSRGVSLEPEVADALTAQLNATIIVGLRRTPRQDVECAIDELVEVAVRSLSPGINDPFTAMNCIDRLGEALGSLAERKLATPFRYDEEGNLRIIARPVAFADVLDAAFNQIRQYSLESVAVTIRLLETFASIAEHASREEDRVALRLHAEMVARHAEAAREQHDREGISEGLRQVVNALGERDEVAQGDVSGAAQKA